MSEKKENYLHMVLITNHIHVCLAYSISKNIIIYTVYLYKILDKKKYCHMSWLPMEIRVIRVQKICVTVSMMYRQMSYWQKKCESNIHST